MQIDPPTARRNTLLAGLDEATLVALLPAPPQTSLRASPTSTVR